MDKKLVTYVRSALHQGFTLAQVAERLRTQGWPEHDIEQALAAGSQHHRQKARLLFAIAGFIAFLLLGSAVFFLVISPAFVEKPVLERPLLEFVDENMIAYVLTELGAYKLHANPLSGDLPELEIKLTDLQQTFTAIVQDNVVRVSRGPAESPDVVVEVAQDAVLLLARAQTEDEFTQRTAQLLRERDQRGYNAMVFTDEKDLLLKGYLALYQEHQAVVEASGIASTAGGPADAGITGGVIAELPLVGSGVIGMFVIILALWSALLLRLAFDR